MEMKTDKTRKLIAGESASIICVLAETQRQVEAWESLTVNKTGHLQRMPRLEAVGEAKL